MKFEVNNEVFMIIKPDENKPNELILTDQFEQLAKALTIIFNTWNDEQCHNEAVLVSEKKAALKLKAMAELLIVCADKAHENGF